MSKPYSYIVADHTGIYFCDADGVIKKELVTTVEGQEIALSQVSSLLVAKNDGLKQTATGVEGPLEPDFPYVGGTTGETFASSIPEPTEPEPIHTSSGDEDPEDEDPLFAA